MKIIAVSGYKDVGKSTLCRALLRALMDRGLKVGYIKRTQEFVASPAGTDSGDAENLGAPALLWGDGSFRYESLCPGADETCPYEVVGRYFPDADAVILEGGKNLNLPRIWVKSEAEMPDVSGVFAIYDRNGSGNGEEIYGADEVGRLAGDVIQQVERVRKSASVYVGGHELPMKDFVADFVAGGVRGMLGALKNPRGDDASSEIRVYLRGREPG
jgi:molybdopterin-guanine dinucleotide biosynthesis protein B